MSLRPVDLLDTEEGADAVIQLLKGAATAAFGPDGMLYIVNSGAFGQSNGSLSVVDPANLREVEHHAGFGEFPGDIAFDAAGRAYVSSFRGLCDEKSR